MLSPPVGGEAIPLRVRVRAGARCDLQLGAGDARRRSRLATRSSSIVAGSGEAAARHRARARGEDLLISIAEMAGELRGDADGPLVQQIVDPLTREVGDGAAACIGVFGLLLFSRSTATTPLVAGLGESLAAGARSAPCSPRATSTARWCRSSARSAAPRSGIAAPVVVALLPHQRRARRCSRARRRS